MGSDTETFWFVYAWIELWKDSFKKSKKEKEKKEKEKKEKRKKKKEKKDFKAPPLFLKWADSSFRDGCITRAAFGTECCETIDCW